MLGGRSTEINPTGLGGGSGNGNSATLPRTGITLLFQLGAARALLGAGGTITTVARRRNR